MANIELRYGPLGAGKSFTAVAFAQASLRARRRCFSSFPILGCRPLLTLADTWLNTFAGSDFIFDEVGTMYGSREWQDLDQLMFSGLTHSRHQDCNVLLLAQHPMLVDKHIRLVAEEYVRVERVRRRARGEVARKHMVMRPDGSFYLPKNKRPGFFSRPWFFRLFYYNAREDFTQEGEVKLGVEPRRTGRVWFTWKRALSYNSWNHVPPPHLRMSIKQLKRTAVERYNLDPWQMGPDGALVGPEISEEMYESLDFPVAESAIEKEVKQHKAEQNVSRLEAAARYRQYQLEMLGVRKVDPRARELEVQFGPNGRSVRAWVPEVWQKRMGWVDDATAAYFESLDGIGR